MSDVHKEVCPKCGYEMTKPFEWRCPICIEYNPEVKLPINLDVLLSVKPLPEEKKSK